MTTRIAVATRNAMQDQITARVDAGAAAGKIQIRSGAQPATADTAASGTLLATVTLNDPSFGASSAGVITAIVSPTVSGAAVATGTAGWARVLDSDNNAIFDGSVGTSGADFIISGTAITTGQTVVLNSATLTLGVPA